MNDNNIRLSRMASGRFCLEIRENISRDDFESLADKVVDQIEATVLDKLDSVDMIIWKIKVKGVALRLVWEDYPSMVSIESSSAEGDRCIAEYVKGLL